jgi:hypothetical protein
VTYIDTSLADTIHTLLMRDEEKKAHKLMKEFKLSEKRYGWIKMRALIAAKKAGPSGPLEKFAKEKKQPIPMESFVKCLVADGLKDVRLIKLIVRLIFGRLLACLDGLWRSLSDIIDFLVPAGCDTICWVPQGLSWQPAWREAGPVVRTTQKPRGTLCTLHAGFENVIHRPATNGTPSAACIS